jgi:exodeoxyribonuclease-3
VRVVTWNVNSVKARLPRFLTWLEERQPDVVLLQETKATDASWPADVLAERGYESAHLGTGRWNGVAVVSRVGLTDVTYGLEDQPLFDDVLEPRALGATCGGVRLWSLYVPNGRGLDTPHYDYKLRFLAAVRAQAAKEMRAHGPDVPYGLVGDFNIAPHDTDVWDIRAFDGLTHVSAPERSALEALMAGDGETTAMADLMPRASADTADTRHPYTFWEMRQLGFQKGRGMRIDLALANAALANRTEEVWVDRDTRKGQGPSDHAPLVLDIR